MNFWTITLPLIAASVAWIFNEWRKRVCENYQRKEQRYIRLFELIKAFYKNAPEVYGKEKTLEMRQEFLTQINLCWLYCPDEIIIKANQLALAIQQGSNKRELLAGELMLELRKDLLRHFRFKPTKLSADDFRHFTASTKIVSDTSRDVGQPDGGQNAAPD